MPSRTTTDTATAAPVAKKFELPALEFKFASLTDGTDIPPPLPSPVLEKPEKPKALVAKAEDKKELANGESKANGNHAASTESQADTTKSGVKRPAEDSLASPTLSTRQGSIRRLFSRNLLNSAYTNGDAEGQGHNSMDAGSTRPTSRSNGSIGDSRKAKRSSGWFRRLRGADDGNKRASAVFEEVKKPAGPPPPMIPELSDLEAKLDLDEKGSLGSDLFKDIKVE